ncbi:hypothetical protein VPH35_093753 [Triticum aestivum]|nr:wax ester synthase/diacylglycerol acyltransferase 11-like [Triticum aestivum]
MDIGGRPSASADLRSRPALSVRTKARAPAADTDERTASEEEPVSPTARLMEDVYVVVTIGLGSPINVPAFTAGVANLISPYSRFHCIQVTEGGNRRWARVKVNVDEHIVVPELDPVAVAANPDRAVEDYVASLSVYPMDPSRPRWEFHLLDFPTSEPGVVSTVAIRAHHSLGDGVSLMVLLLASARSAADPTSLPVMPQQSVRTGAIYARQPRHAGALARVWSWFVLMWHTMVDLCFFSATILFLRDPHTVFKPAADDGDDDGDGVFHHHNRRFVHRSLSLDDVKFVKNAMNCTVNDVLLGVASAALSRYYFRKSGDINTKEICLRSVLGVNIRPTTSLQTYVNMIKSDKSNEVAWGNQLGQILLKIHLAMHDDPLAYVRKAKETMDRKKSSLEVVFTHKTSECFLKMFGPKGGAFIFGRMFTNTTLSFSNMIGPAEQIELYGHPVVFIAPSAYGVSQALIVHYQSYNSIMKVILSVDEKTIPDYHQLLDDFSLSFEHIMDATSRLLASIKKE